MEDIRIKVQSFEENRLRYKKHCDIRSKVELFQKIKIKSYYMVETLKITLEHTWWLKDLQHHIMHIPDRNQVYWILNLKF